MKFKMIFATIFVLGAASPSSVLSQNNEGPIGQVAKSNCEHFLRQTYEWKTTDRYGKIQEQKILLLNLLFTNRTGGLFNGYAYWAGTLAYTGGSLNFHCVFDEGGNALGVETW